MAAILKIRIHSNKIHANAIEKLVSTNTEEIYKNYTKEKLTLFLSLIR